MTCTAMYGSGAQTGMMLPTMETRMKKIRKAQRTGNIRSYAVEAGAATVPVYAQRTGYPTVPQCGSIQSAFGVLKTPTNIPS